MMATSDSCRMCDLIQSGKQPDNVPFCRNHQRADWVHWRGIWIDTPCLHCTHDGQDTDGSGGGSPDWCPHCEHEGHGRGHCPDTCSHCALYVINAPLPHRKLVMEVPNS